MVFKEPTEDEAENLRFYSKQLLYQKGAEKPTGKVLLWCFKGEINGKANYTCPYCEKENSIEQELKIPLKFQ